MMVPILHMTVRHFVSITDRVAIDNNDHVMAAPSSLSVFLVRFSFE